jgi:hypothetical protein
LHSFLIFLMIATCPAHFILLDSIVLIIFGGVYNFWSSSLCSLLQPSAIFSLFGPNIHLSCLLKTRERNATYILVHSIRFTYLNSLLVWSLRAISKVTSKQTAGEDAIIS